MVQVTAVLCSKNHPEVATEDNFLGIISVAKYLLAAAFECYMQTVAHLFESS
jgi:hypothetical protein